MPLDQTVIGITKLEAARRQLSTAIWLWFVDGDPVSTHTLAYAAYEIIHVVSKHRKRTQKLLFDATFMSGKYQAEVTKFLKKHANFFKHAKKDVEDNINFPPAISVLFIMSSVMGIISMRLPRSNAETDFMVWHAIHDPEILTDHGRKAFIDTIGVQQLDYLRGLSKKDFLESCQRARQQLLGQR